MSAERPDYADAIARYVQRSKLRAATTPEADDGAAIRALEEALEELSVSAEELRVQNDELQAALRGNDVERNRYRALFESAPDAYIVSDEHGVIREANRAASTLLHVPQARLIGKPLAIYLPAAERRAFRSRIMSLSRLENMYDWDVSIARRTGDIVPVSISAVGLADPGSDMFEIRWLIRDQTERRRAAEAQRQLLSEQAARLAAQHAERRALFLANASRTFAGAKSPEEILQIVAALAAPFLGTFCLVDRLEEGRIVRSAARLADDGHRELLAELFQHVPLRDHLDPVTRVIRTGEAELIDRRPGVPRPDGDRVEQILDALGTRTLVVVPLWGQSGVLGAVTIGTAEPATDDASVSAVVRSFAERAALALEHSLLLQLLEASRREALDANRAKADFLAALSHEIRTPLTAALGYTELLMDGVPEALPERAAEFARGIRASIHHQIAIVDDLLLFARVEAGVEQVRLGSVDVGDVMQEVAVLIGPDAAAGGVPLVLDLPDPPILVETDRAKLRQILLNLSGNAVRHTERGEIRISAERTVDSVRIDVSDTGVGIPKEDLDRVFERFWRGDPAPGRKRGIGLGLTITRHLVQLLGGEVSVGSTPGFGSVFTVTLPLRRAEAPTGPSSHGPYLHRA